jgi:UDP:flavonoid glycosyltransferase YjiC (YdhE family)
MIAIGAQLRARDVDVRIAAPTCHEGACRESGFSFVPIGSTADYVSSLGYSRSILTGNGYEQFIERLNFDRLEELYVQLLAAADGSDAIVAPVHVVPAHLVAEKKCVPYIACALAVAHIRSPAKLGSEEYRRQLTASTRWHSALRKLRLDQGLRRKILPFASLLRDATKVLGVLPRFLLSDDDIQKTNLEVVGYAEYNHAQRMVQDHELRSFCDERTVAFSFGSFADACDPMHFFTESLAACRLLNRKCVYLSRYLPSTARDATSKNEVLVRADVAPDAVFPLVGAVVHHGGTGTLIAASKHSKPMAIVPFFLDQPQNAARMQSLVGVPSISAIDYDRYSAVDALQCVFDTQEVMRDRLRVLMTEYRDGALPGAQSILAALNQSARPST